MNMTMVINALNGIIVDNVFVRNEDIDEMTFECEHCGERHLRGTSDIRIFDVDGEEWCEDCFDEDSFACDRCGSRHCIDDMYEVRTRGFTEYWCDSCAGWYSAVCEECGDRYDVDEMTTLANGDHVCDECRDDYYAECADCGEWYRTDDMVTTRDDEFVCEYCINEGYSYCDSCNSYVRNADYDDDLDMCNSCAEEQGRVETERLISEIYAEAAEGDSNSVARSSNAVVRPYHSRPPFHFFGSDRNWFIGAELEVDSIDGSPTRQRTLNRIDRVAGDRVYFNSDCSLNHGFEIITHPHTLGAFNEIPWAEIMQACKDNGYSSHDAGTCGLHFHFSREAFGDDVDTQDDNISKLVQFFEFYWDDMVKASRRGGDQLRWCNKKGYVSKKRIKDYVKEKWGGHDEAINNGNRDTVEIRIMRGTLNIDSFNACFDLCVKLVENACRIDWGDVCEADEMLKGIKPETARYLYNRNAFRDVVSRMM